MTQESLKVEASAASIESKQKDFEVAVINNTKDIQRIDELTTQINTLEAETVLAQHSRGTIVNKRDKLRGIY